MEGALVILAGLFMVLIGWLSRVGKLPRNHWVGIRIPTTLRTDAGWMAAQRAGSLYTIAAGVLFSLWGLWLLVDIDEARDRIWFFTGPALAILLFGAFRGRAAAIEAPKNEADGTTSL